MKSNPQHLEFSGTNFYHPAYHPRSYRVVKKQSVGKAGKLPLKTTGPKLGHEAGNSCRVVHRLTKLVRSCPAQIHLVAKRAQSWSVER